MVLVGVTGGIGAGKTSFLAMCDELGNRTLDADAVVHRLYAPGTAVFQAVLGRWGPQVLGGDGTLDRAAVARLVFGSETELNWLNALVHPLVKETIVEQAASGPGPLFCGVPLLFEAGWEKHMAFTVAVWCDPATQRRRLHGRGWTDAEIAARQARQLPMDAKLELADFGVINIGSLDMLAEQCRRLCDRIGRKRAIDGRTR